MSLKNLRTVINITAMIFSGTFLSLIVTAVIRPKRLSGVCTSARIDSIISVLTDVGLAVLIDRRDVTVSTCFVMVV